MKSDGEGFRNQTIQFESEPGIEIGAACMCRARPAESRRCCCWRATLSNQLAESMAETGRVVLKFSNRGMSPVRTIDRPFRRRLADQHTGGPDRAQPAGACGRTTSCGGSIFCASRDDVDPDSIRAAGQGVQGQSGCCWRPRAIRESEGVARQDALQPAPSPRQRR